MRENHAQCVKHGRSARGRLLQMPLACIRIDFKPGVSECYILERRPQTNYESIVSLFKNVRISVRDHPLASVKSSPFLPFVSPIVNIRYAIYKASGVTATQAHKQFGFEHMNERSKRVEEALKHAQNIR